MDFKFSKDSGDAHHQDAPGEKKKQGTLLVLLLILIGGFTYIYFFTGLIKPQEALKTVETPAPVTEVVKIPLPPREGEPAKPDGKTLEKTTAPKTAAITPKVVAPVVKPIAAPAKPKEEPNKAEAAKPGAKKPQPTTVAGKMVEKVVPAKSEAKKPSVEAKKPAASDKKSAPSKDGTKKAGSDAQAKQKNAVKARKTATGSWSLVVGNYVLEEALSADMVRVRKAGYKPIVKPSARKKTTMNRLFVSEFNDRATAQSTLEKLNRLTSDAFVMGQGGKFAVYAGSYLQAEAANSEKERLKAAGFTAIVKHADIAIPSQSLSVGPFSSIKAAESARGKLRGAGIKASLAQR